MEIDKKIDPKLVKIRELLVKNKLDGYILPRTDAHESEYLPPWEERL